MKTYVLLMRIHILAKVYKTPLSTKWWVALVCQVICCCVSVYGTCVLQANQWATQNGSINDIFMLSSFPLMIFNTTKTHFDSAIKASMEISTFSMNLKVSFLKSILARKKENIHRLLIICFPNALNNNRYRVPMAGFVGTIEI